MDAMSKNLSINEARMLIHKLINDSDTNTIENFWLIELDKLHLSVNDSNVFDRILNLKSDDSEVSKILYNNCIKGNVIHDLLKKNWRRFFNNNVIEKYNDYIKEEQFLDDKIWKMGNHEIVELKIDPKLVN